MQQFWVVLLTLFFVRVTQTDELLLQSRRMHKRIPTRWAFGVRPAERMWPIWIRETSLGVSRVQL